MEPQTERIEMMPCPECKTMHPRSRHNLHCRCGAVLFVSVPLFTWNAEPYGWKFEVRRG